MVGGCFGWEGRREKGVGEDGAGATNDGGWLLPKLTLPIRWMGEGRPHQGCTYIWECALALAGGGDRAGLGPRPSPAGVPLVKARAHGRTHVRSGTRNGCGAGPILGPSSLTVASLAMTRLTNKGYFRVFAFPRIIAFLSKPEQIFPLLAPGRVWGGYVPRLWEDLPGGESRQPLVEPKHALLSEDRH